MMFDLIRNGKAHQYNSAIVTLNGLDIDMDLTGAVPGTALNKNRRKRPAKHLNYKVSPAGDLSLFIRTDQLYLDVRNAIKKSGLLEGAGPVSDISRQSGKNYSFTVPDLDHALKNGSHVKSSW